jgi:hypothetical protein
MEHLEDCEKGKVQSFIHVEFFPIKFTYRCDLASGFDAGNQEMIMICGGYLELNGK